MAEQSVADVLNEAAEIVERGWCQGLFRDGDKFCVSGAIRHLTGLQDITVHPAFALFCRVTGAKDITRWNDAHERSQSEVVAKLREAAALAAQEA